MCERASVRFVGYSPHDHKDMDPFLYRYLWLLGHLGPTLDNQTMFSFCFSVDPNIYPPPTNIAPSARVPGQQVPSCRDPFRCHDSWSESEHILESPEMFVSGPTPSRPIERARKRWRFANVLRFVFRQLLVDGQCSNDGDVLPGWNRPKHGTPRFRGHLPGAAGLVKLGLDRLGLFQFQGHARALERGGKHPLTCWLTSPFKRRAPFEYLRQPTTKPSW